MRFPLYLIFILPLFLSCDSANKEKKEPEAYFDKQAHRGGRGLVPENTIIAGKTAIDYDCTLEIDLQMSKDQKIVVSHDAYFSNDFSLTPEGDTMTKKEGRSRLLFDMPYDSIAKYDVGSKPHPDFPRQKNSHAVKPLLSILIDSVEAYARQKDHISHYNIEIKSNPKADGKAYSSVEEFVDLTMEVINDKNIADRTMIQSFDIRALKRVHEKYPEVETSYLVFAANDKSAEGYIEDLGFTPDIFSPHFTIVTEDLVDAFHQLDVLVIPWTPNTAEDIQRLKDMGVDGVITDYPDLFAQVK